MMGGAKGTAVQSAHKMKSQSMKSRPATSGNKNVRAKAKRKSAMSQLQMGRTTPIVGPDRGAG